MRHIHFLWVICTPLAIISVEQQTVHIGAVLPFDDEDGNQLLAGSLMAIRDLNALYEAERNISFKIAVRDSGESFSDSILASLDIAINSFGGKGVHVLIGAGSNTQSEALAFASRDHDIAMIGYACNASSLSHEVEFPQVSRVYPSSSNEGTAIAHMISSYFGYTRVILIHSSDEYGIDGANLFTQAAVTMEIDILISAEINFFDNELLPMIKIFLPYDCRVFVLILSDVGHAGHLLREGSTANLFNANTLLFCSGSLLTSQSWSLIVGKNQESSRMMGGIFTVSVADNDWKVTTKGQEFIQKFRSLPNTLIKYPNGTIDCPTEKDDDGKFFLYRRNSDSIGRTYNCTGNVFTDLAENGEDISPYAAYTYDATWAAGLSTLLYARTIHNDTVPSRISGTVLQSIMAIKPRVSFTGYTGLIAFSDSRSGIDHYGTGDRILGVRYSISNFHPGNGSETDFSFKRIGTWTSESGFALCGTDPTLQSAVTGGCFKVEYGTIGNLRPSDRAPTVYRKMSENLKLLLYFCAAIDLSIVTFFAVVLVVYRKTRLLRALQPFMMWIILTANIFNGVRIILAAMPASPVVCKCGVWMGHLGT
jgi:Receptor family ligand binding region